MTRGQRAAHRVLWLMLAPALLALLAFALLNRADASAAAAPRPEVRR